MAHTLTYSTTTLQLPPHLLWVNEFDWLPVSAAAPRYSVTGALLMESGLRQAGRPIELAGESGWVLRSDLLLLRAWAAVPGRQFSLVVRDEAPRNVKFDHAGGALQATPVWDVSDPAPSDFYRLVLRFIEV